MKILIVEDDFTSAKYLQELSKTLGYESLTAENGKIAIDTYEQFKPDVILSDIQMPVMNGLEMLEEIRKRQSEAIIVMLTAYGSEEYAMQSFRLGANNYLKKPVNHKDLVLMLKRYDQLVQSRTGVLQFPGEFIRREFTVKFKTNTDFIPLVVDRLVKETGEIFNHADRTDLEIGLSELVMNAVEHGNLEISSFEKSAALQRNQLPQLYKERQNDPQYGERQVTISFKYDSECCEWMIEDEGPGFDWEMIPDPTQGDNLLELNGRGIFISRFQFDELKYLGRGNIVVVKKYVKVK